MHIFDRSSITLSGPVLQLQDSHLHKLHATIISAVASAISDYITLQPMHEDTLKLLYTIEPLYSNHT